MIFSKQYAYVWNYRNIKKRFVLVREICSPIELKSRNIVTLPSFVGNATNDIDVTKQCGHAASETDIDDHDNSNRTYQYKAALIHEFTSVEVIFYQNESSLYACMHSRCLACVEPKPGHPIPEFFISCSLVYFYGVSPLTHTYNYVLNRPARSPIPRDRARSRCHRLTLSSSSPT